jgi:uncharacterized protein
MNPTPPSIGHDERYFWDGVAAGQLLLQRCDDCAAVRHPPLPLCPQCGSLQWSAQPASGQGTVHSWIVCDPAGPGVPARIAAAIRLREGVCFVANLEGVDAAAVRNDMAVEVDFVPVDGHPFPVFRPAAG